MQWLFNVAGESLVGEQPVAGFSAQQETDESQKQASTTPSTFFRTVVKKFAGTSSSSPIARSNGASTNEGHFNSGLVAVEGCKSTFRCAMRFGVRCEPVFRTSDEANQQRQKNHEELDDRTHSATFRISVMSEEGAAHGVSVGLAPTEATLDTPMLWNEPGAAVLNCTSKGAQIWSSSLNLFGVNVSSQCLERFPRVAAEKNGDGNQDQQQQQEPFVGGVNLQWNLKTGTVKFSVLDPEAIAKGAPDLPVIGSGEAKYNHDAAAAITDPMEQFAVSHLVPTIALSTETMTESVSLL